MTNDNLNNMNIPQVERCCDFEDKYDYVLCTRYGDYGLIPTTNRYTSACVSSSGESVCGYCCGYEQITNTNLCIVKCSGHNCFD